MMISLRLAKREIKNNFKYWTLFVLNLSLGLLGFTFILLFRNNINSALEMRSRTILSSDIAISGRRALSGDEKKSVANFLEDKTELSTKLVEVYSMAKGKSIHGVKTRLTLIKSIQGQFPLVGEIFLASGQKVSKSFINELQKSPQVLISKEVSHQFKVDVGDELKLGELPFKIKGIIEKDSTTSMRGMSLAPKIYIGLSQLKGTGLVKFGSVAWYTDFYTILKDLNIQIIKKDIEDKITDPAISVRTPTDSGQQVGRVLNYLTDYLGLIGVVALLISAVGSSYLFQNYLYQKLNQIGVYKSVGLQSRQIIASFSWVVLFFGALSSLFALVISQGILPMALSFTQQWIIFDSAPQISWDIIAGVFGVGLFANLLISTPILMRIFSHKTLDLLGGTIKEGTSGKKIKDFLYYTPGFLFLWGLSIWQAHSFKIGSIFIISLSVIFSLVLFILPLVFQKLSRSFLGKLVSFPLSLVMGISSRLFLRNKMSSILTILSLSVGITLLVVIGQLDASLKSELTDSGTKKPSLFMFDIQDEQMDELVSFSKKNNIPLMQPSPMIRGRLIKKNGKAIERKSKGEGFTTREEDTKRRFNNRGVNLTYAKSLNSSETIVEGKEFSGVYKGEGEVEVSLEKRYAKRLEVGVGDTLTYDILGVEVKAKVVNLRTIKWTSFLPNFFITLQPGYLEDAPKSFITAVEKVSFERQLEIQDMIVEKFSNISILNVSEVIKKVLTLFKAMAWAINLMSYCCIIVGLFVLYSILQGQLFKKQTDFALQKLLGLNKSSIFKALYLEYLLMIGSSILCGNFLGIAISYLVSALLLNGIYVFNWSFFIFFNSGLILLTSILVLYSFERKYNKKINHLLNE